MNNSNDRTGSVHDTTTSPPAGSPISKGNKSHDDRLPATSHPNHYCYAPGMPLRPPPPRVTINRLWTSQRHNMLRRWVRDLDVHDNPCLPLLQDHYWQGDPYMDPVIAQFRATTTGMRNGRRMLERALEHGIDSVPDAPAELVALFEHLDNPPAWYDPDIWERGRQLWNNTSLSAHIAMSIQDGMGTYVGAEVSTAVGITGRFVNDFDRRNVETVQWFHQATNPGALHRHAEEFKATIRVRMMHSQARLAIMNAWSAEEYAHHGNPISTAMTMVAGTTFGLIPVLFDDRYGRRASWSDLEAITHYWAYICYVFGVAPEIIPTTASDALDIMNYGVATAGGPTPWTHTMVAAATDQLARTRGVRGSLTRAAVSPAAGAVAVFSGEALLRALLAHSPYEHVRLQPWRTLAGLLVRADLTIRRIGDAIPGATRRRARRTPRGDVFEGAALKLLRARARRLGILADYTQHDSLKVSGCPVRHE